MNMRIRPAVLLVIARGGAPLAKESPVPSSGRTGSHATWPHPRANLPVWPPPGEEILGGGAILAPYAAAESAAVAPTDRGVTAPLTCEARWIAAAVSGCLVHARGDLDVDDGRLPVFRIGIRDGAEVGHGGTYRAGAECVLIARGWDSAGAGLASSSRPRRRARGG